MAATDKTRKARRDREREIIDATRALFDERGVQEAAIEDIARVVGINKALIYRHFRGKEELYVLAVTRYLEELRALLESVPPGEPRARLRAMTERYVDFGLAYPAFLDCALSLMRRPFAELAEAVSGSVLFQLGASMAATLAPLRDVLEQGAAAGDFTVRDPAAAANLLYAGGLGTLHLARIGTGVRPAGGSGFPEVFTVDVEDVREACVASALGLAGA